MIHALELTPHAILTVMEIDPEAEFMAALRECQCAVCRSLRAERESGNHDLLVHLKDPGQPMVQTVQRRRPLARPPRLAVKSLST